VATTTEPQHEPFGDWLRRTRDAEDVDQTELAAITGLSRGAISNIETGKTGKPLRRTAMLLARALHQDEEDVLARAGHPVPYRGKPRPTFDSFVETDPDLNTLSPQIENVARRLLTATYDAFVEIAREG
jgi:transcriptional regulator with XRE-family HTH domain